MSAFWVLSPVYCVYAWLILTVTNDNFGSPLESIFNWYESKLTTKFSEAPFKPIGGGYLILFSEKFSVACFEAVCHHYACAAFPNRCTNTITTYPTFSRIFIPHISLVAFSAKQGRRSRCIFARFVLT